MFNGFLLIFFICCELNKLLHVFSCSMLQNNAFQLPSRPRLHASPFSLWHREHQSLSLLLEINTLPVPSFGGGRGRGLLVHPTPMPALQHPHHGPSTHRVSCVLVERTIRMPRSHRLLAAGSHLLSLSFSLLKYDKRAPLPSVQSFFLP